MERSFDDRYCESGDKEKLLRAVKARSCFLKPLPTTENMKAELASLSVEKVWLLAEYKTTRSKAQDYETIKQNVDMLLTVPKEQWQQELE